MLAALALAIDGLLLVAFITADPVSGMYMAALAAVGLPVGIVLHRHRRATSESEKPQRITPRRERRRRRARA